jgi:TonB family protein
MKFLSAFCLLFAACATGGVARDPSAVRVVLDDETSKIFPAAKNPQLPSADRLSDTIRAGLGEVASADIRVCVRPDGRVQAVDLVRGSSLAAFDEAVLHDAADWQFSGMPGSSTPIGLRTCRVATISYRPHR